MNGETGRSREAVRNSVRAYGVKVMDPASLPLRKSKETESQESVSRFSEKSLHSQYEIREGCCQNFLNRVPYATLVGCILCLLGVVVFSTGRHRGAVMTNAMINDVLQDNAVNLALLDTLFMVFEIITAVISVMILITGFLATGDTRARVYGAWKARVGGRLCCAFLMILTMLLFFVWMMIIWLFAVLVYVVIISKIECDLYSSLGDDKQCLYLPMLNIFILNQKKEIKVCDAPTVKKFCKDYVEKASAAYATAAIANFLIIFSLVLFLICLAANYARIRCQAKFQEVEELRHLEGDLHNSKDRF